VNRLHLTKWWWMAYGIGKRKDNSTQRKRGVGEGSTYFFEFGKIGALVRSPGKGFLELRLRELVCGREERDERK